MTTTLEPPTGSTRRSRRLGDHLVRVAEAATTPYLPADFMDLFAPLRSGADLRGRIESVHPETADAATIVIRPGADWAGHVPGQYLRIGIDVDGVRQWRAYSLTHGPRRDGRISITVKAVPDGLVSNHLVHRAEPGTLVHLEQAAGEFVLPPAGGKFLMVTAGSGITPVIGMLRNLFPSTDDGVLRPARSADHDIVVVHVAPSHPDSIFIRDLEALDAAGAIRLVARYDDEHGVLDVDDLADLRARPRRAHDPRLRAGRPARRPRRPPRGRGDHPDHRAVPHRPRRARATAAPSASPPAPPSTSTVPRPSSTRPRRPAC